MLNEAKGNMYGFVSHTWNTIKGECPHGCEYCYMKRWGKQNPVRFDEKELKTDLGEGNYIFVGSSCDMWANDIPDDWIYRTFEHCIEYPKNKYLFQSKNPGRFKRVFSTHIDADYVTTIESNRWYPEMKNSPPPYQRAKDMIGYDKCEITLEPIMDFDLDELLHWLKEIKPSKVNIGANSRKDIKLKEPNADKVRTLIDELGFISDIHIKPNLKRIYSGG